MPKLVLIAAIAENGVIGDKNDLPWGRSIPRDMDRFKLLTKRMGVVLMGRKTAESLRKPLPGRRNIVLSRNAVNLLPGFEVIDSLSRLKTLFPESQAIAVIGGAEIYRLCAPHAHRAYLTRVHTEFSGDTFFPHDALDSYTRKDALQSFAADENNAHALTFITAHNNKVKPL